MRIYDVSVSLHENLVVWPGEARFRREIKARIRDGHHCNVSAVAMGAHTGTHIDAPYHFEDDGIKIDEIPSEVLVGPATVFEIKAENEIRRSDLEPLKIRGKERVLLKTRNSALLKIPDFQYEYAHLDEQAARYLVEQGIKLLGVDYLSVEQPNLPEAPIHHILLRKGIVIVETLDLSSVPPGDYELMALPLKIQGCEGAPARVFLRTV